MGRVRGLRAGFLLALALVAGALPGAPAPGTEPCVSGPAHPAGDWDAYGNDAANTRHQPEENLINPTNVGSLTKKWHFSIAADGASGVINSTPLVDGNCIFATFATLNTGWLVALHEDGTRVWRHRLDASGGPTVNSLAGNALVGSPALASGCLDGSLPADCVIIAGGNLGRPVAQAVRRADGALLWETVLTTHPDAFVVASPVVYDGLVFVGISGNEARPTARGGYAILDVATGALLKFGWTIPDEDYAINPETGNPRYAGASIWGTPAVDTATGFLYAGGGNPASKRWEHPHANALLKIDLRRTVGSAPNPDFGEIVDAYKGTSDQYFSGLDRQPACDAFGDNPDLNRVPWSLACVQLDLDFGASPQLFHDSRGRLLVGALQKSGIYHAAFAGTMQLAWTQLVGGPCVACNAASTAVDGERIYAATTPGGQFVALNVDGRLQWVTPVADLIHFQSVSSAYGVVYGMDTDGNLNAFDALTGLPLLKRPVSLDVGTTVTGNGSNGVAIARNRVFVAVGPFLVAYGL